MAPSKWDDEEKESDSTPPSSPPVVLRRSYSDDEEEDGDVPDDWRDGEDSEVEREKAKKAEEAKAKAEAEAKANHKTKAQRIEEAVKRTKEKNAKALDEYEFETEEDRVAYALQQEKDSDLAIAADLLGDIGISNNRAVKPVVVPQSGDPTNVVDISSLPLFNPVKKDDFENLRKTLAPLLAANAQKPQRAQYALFLPEFTKEIVRDLKGDEIQTIITGLTVLKNEKINTKKGGKKTKAAQKSRLVAPRPKVDTTDYGNTNDGSDLEFM